MRRLLADARRRYPHESFVVEGAILPGAEGDEEWRATASAHSFSIARLAEGDSIECTDRGTGAACSARVSAVLTSEPKDHLVSWLIRKILYQKQVPCLLEGEDRVSSRLLHCP